jgi:hypothetical protein
MEEGFLTLMFILFMVAASIMDAVGRRKKKQRRMEEMEAEEEAQMEGRASRPVSRQQGDRSEPSQPEAYRQRRPEGDSRARDTGPSTTTTPGGGPQAEERDPESAETMVPEDLWAILTGQPPREREPQRTQPRREGARSGDDQGSGRSPSTDPGPDPQIPVPVPQDRMSTGASKGSGAGSKEEDPPTRRSSRWMEGTRGRGESESWSAGGAIQEEEREAYGLAEEPWGPIEGIASADLTEAGEGEIQQVSDGAAFQTSRPGRRQTSADTRYTRLLTTGDVEDLRKAIVLREVMGPPVAFRDEIGPER